jgi:hypothetical protein
MVLYLTSDYLYTSPPLFSDALKPNSTAPPSSVSPAPLSPPQPVDPYAVPDAYYAADAVDPWLGAGPRANGVLVMLARNTDVDGAISSVRRLEDRFNRRRRYPWVFLNEVEFDDNFKQ